MAIKLQKSQGISLRKDNGEMLEEIILGAGWKEIENIKIQTREVQKPGFLNRLLGRTETVSNSTKGNKIDVDLDATILAYKGNSFINECSFRNQNLFIGDTRIAKSMGDDRTGHDKKTETDNEQIKIFLSKVDRNKVDTFYLIMNIYGCKSNGQTLDMIEKSYCKVYDNQNNILAKFDLSEDYGKNTGVLIGKVSVVNGSWKFTAIGEGYKVTNIDDFISQIR